MAWILIPIAGAWVTKKLKDTAVAVTETVKNLGWQDVIESLPTLLKAGVLAIFLGPVGKILWKAAAKVWLLALVYTFFTQWVTHRLWPVLVAGMELLPTSVNQALLNACARAYQVVLATEHFIPWSHCWTVAKWIIVLKLWILAFHLVDWVWQKTRQVLDFLFG